MSHRLVVPEAQILIGRPMNIALCYDTRQRLEFKAQRMSRLIAGTRKQCFIQCKELCDLPVNEAERFVFQRNEEINKI
jgi:hypothetical protein